MNRIPLFLVSILLIGLLGLQIIPALADSSSSGMSLGVTECILIKGLRQVPMSNGWYFDSLSTDNGGAIFVNPSGQWLIVARLHNDRILFSTAEVSATPYDSVKPGSRVWTYSIGCVKPQLEFLVWLLHLIGIFLG